MRIYQKLAAATAGAAVLAFVGTAPAVAANFFLSGRLGAVRSTTLPPTPLDNGSFDGTYSYSGETLRYPDRLGFTIDSFNINIRTADGQIVETFNPNNSSADFSVGTLDLTNPSMIQVETGILEFISSRDNSILSLSFPSLFAGVGDEGSEAYSGRTFATVRENSVRVSSATSSATSEAVPEPLTIVGSGIALGFSILMQKNLLSRKIKSRKNNLTIQS